MHELPCPPTHWPRFSELLDVAMDVPEAARAGWLDALSGDDAAIRPWLARVLDTEAQVSTGQFLRPPQLGGDNAAFTRGVCVGPYRLEAPLGEGGMGEVWRASRHDDGPHREVALKLPYAELLGGPFRQRFARERDMLAALSHPHIAQLYDAGSSAEGHPYLALELVAGQPITAACRSTGASLERRIELTIQVLQGLAYAHQRLIVHRDIKPSNVLVTPEGNAKLLDFGIAKMLGGEVGVDSTLTQPQARLATPAYAAPEQLSGGTMTVATDVFSAGVLLFELCTGHRPFPRVPADAHAEAAPLASQRADAQAAGMAEARRLAACLRGDLDAVIAQAIALEPAARYPSAEAFAADLRRWRAGMPVRARRVGWAVRSRKFVKRNKLGVSLAGFLVLTLAGGAAGIAWQAQRAEAQAARANAVKDYVLGLFAEGDPRGGRPITSMTAKALLDIGADRADAAFARDPATEIELLNRLGNIYDALNDSVRAETAWGRRVALYSRLYGPADARTVAASLDLVSSYVLFQDEDRARALLDRIRAPVFALHGADSLQWAQWLQARASALRDMHGGRDEAIADDLAAQAIYERHFPDNPRYFEVLQDLGGYQYDAEQCAASLASIDRARSFALAHHAFDAMDELAHHSDRASRLTCLGRLQEGEAELMRAQEQAERQLGRQSLWYLHAVVTRAIDAHLTGDRARAHSLLQSLLTAKLDAAAATGLPTSVRRAYGAALAREGRAAEAVPILEAVLAQTRLHLRDEPNLRRTELQLGDAYDQAGRTADARTLLKAARDEYVQYGPTGMPNTLAARERWARFLLDHGETAAAFSEFTALLDSAQGRPSAASAMAAAGLARIALAAGVPGDADAQSARAMALLDATQGIYDVRLRVEVWLARAQALHALGRIDDARSLASRAVAWALVYDDAKSTQIVRSRNVLRNV